MISTSPGCVPCTWCCSYTWMIWRRRWSRWRGRPPPCPRHCSPARELQWIEDLSYSFWTKNVCKGKLLSLLCDLVVALQSWMWPMPPVTSLLSQWHAFRKLFLKLSERKAYSTGFMAELEYWRQSESSITITRVLLWLKPGSWLKLNRD